MASTWKEQLFAGLCKWRLGVGMAIKKKRKKVEFGDEVTSWDATRQQSKRQIFTCVQSFYFVMFLKCLYFP